MRFPKSQATTGPWRSSSSRRQRRENTRTCDTCCVHAAAVRSTGPPRQLVGNRILVTRSARSSAGKPRRRRPTTTTFPFNKMTTIIHRPPFTRLLQPSRIACNPSSSRRRHPSNYYYSTWRYQLMIPGASDYFINEERWLFQKQLTFLKIIFIYDCKSLHKTKMVNIFRGTP